MSKKGNILSLSMDPDIQEKLKSVAKKRDTSVSKLVRDLAEKFINEDDSVDMVVLKVPKSLRGNEREIREWFDKRVSSAVQTLASMKP